jgi:cyclopropane fatty-acyl-phospholipid synthase-like methyltransferase
VLDLGCGVGGTVFALARRFPEGRFHGITISPRQHQIALRLKAGEDPGDRCRFVLGDFQTARLGLEVDAALSIEAFVHASDPDAFLERASEHVRPGGRLLVVDDFLARPRNELSFEAERHVARFQEGWRVPGLCTVAELTARAGRHAFRRLAAHDLTPLVGLERPRDRVIAGLSPWFERLGLIGMPFFANMIGGNALQNGLRKGFLRYVLVVFERAPEPENG